MTDKRIVLTAAASEEEAHKIAHALVDRQLAACVNIIPQIESVYRWQGKVESAREWLLLIKTTAEEKQNRVTELFDKYNLLALPVVDEDGALAGVITADDVISVLRQR